MKLEIEIREKRKKKEILYMTHLVLGYPSFEDNRKQLEVMARHNVDFIELQIPFSEPYADGAIILNANHKSLAQGVNTDTCFSFIEKNLSAFPNQGFLIMTYFNVVFSYGLEKFLTRVSQFGIRGTIIPDLPPEEGLDYRTYSDHLNLASIFLVTPTQKESRIKDIGTFSSGFVYGVLRSGVTGKQTSLNRQTDEVLSVYKKNLTLPLAIGFGIRSKEDIQYLKRHADIAIIGSALISAYDQGGVKEMDNLLFSLVS